MRKIRRLLIKLKEGKVKDSLKISLFKRHSGIIIFTVLLFVLGTTVLFQKGCVSEFSDVPGILEKSALRAALGVMENPGFDIARDPAGNFGVPDHGVLIRNIFRGGIGVQKGIGLGIFILGHVIKLQIPVIIVLFVMIFVGGVYLKFKDIYMKRLLSEKDAEMKKQQMVMEFQISLAEKFIEKEKSKQKELKQELEFKNKQLTSYAFSFEQKNRIIDRLQEIVRKIEMSSTPAEKKQYVRELKAVAKENLVIDKNWECFRNFFQETQYGFHAKLLAKHPDLKPNDLKLCSVIRLNLTIKETADVLGISPGSLKTSRYRLRKKLDLPSKQEIIDYLISFERAELPGNDPDVSIKE